MNEKRYQTKKRDRSNKTCVTSNKKCLWNKNRDRSNKKCLLNKKCDIGNKLSKICYKRNKNVRE